MANFYAIYPPSADSPNTVQTVQGEGTPGVQTGGVLTVQGDPSGTPIPISGSISATNPSVSATGAAVPADITYIGMNVSGTATGLTGTSNGVNTVINAALPAGANVIGAVTQSGAPWSIVGTGTAGSPATAVVTIQGIGSGTAVPISQSGSNWSSNIAQFGGNAVVTGTGVGGNGIPRVTVSSDSSLTSVGTVTTVTGVTTVSTVTAVTAITNALPAGSNLLGKTGIDQTTPGTTNAVQITSGTTIAWQAEGAIAAGSITSSFATIFTPTAATKILFMRNNTNASVSVSMDAGSTTNFVLDAGDQVAIDFIANGVVSTTTAIQIKSTGSPSTGNFRVNGGH